LSIRQLKGLSNGTARAEIRLMPLSLDNCRRILKPVLPGLMALLLLSLGLLASSESAHLKLHHNSTSHHTCAVCAVAKGLVDAPPASVTLFVRTLSFSWALPVFKSVLVAEADFSVASSRGPPLSISSL
jgi:hypothetical protein